MKTRTALAAILVGAPIALQSAPASAGGGDFVGGVVTGVIVKSLIDGSVRTQPRYVAPRRTTRYVQDPAVTAYWKDVQTALNDAGYDAGRPDGVAGRRTRAAVRDFQASIGVEPTGALDPEQYSRLMVAAGYDQPTGPADTTGGPLDAPAADTAPVEPSSVTALQPVNAGSTEALSAFDAPKRNSDAELDAISAGIDVLGIGTGSLRSDARETFADSVGSCSDTGNWVQCTGGNDAFKDDAAFATDGTGNGAPVYFLARTLTFKQPIPAGALDAKLKETLGPILEEPNQRATSSDACDRALDGEGAAEIAAAIRAGAKAPGGDPLADVPVDCRAFFMLSLDENAGMVGKVTVRFFDARLLAETATADASATTVPPVEGPGAVPAKAVPEDVKF